MVGEEKTTANTLRGGMPTISFCLSLRAFKLPLNALALLALTRSRIVHFYLRPFAIPPPLISGLNLGGNRVKNEEIEKEKARPSSSLTKGWC